MIDVRYFYCIILLLSFQLGFAQLSRTHYVPPISVANDSNSMPQNQYLHISTPSLIPISV